MLVHEALWVPVLTSKLLSVHAFAGVYTLGILVSPAWTWLLCVKIVIAVEHPSERSVTCSSLTLVGCLGPQHCQANPDTF